MHCIIGWDIGGAHLIAACLNSAAEITAVYQSACPLWQGLAVLDQALIDMQSQLPSHISLHVVTMTGELVDLFSCKAAGVEAIMRSLKKQLFNAPIYLYAGRLGFIAMAKVTPAQTDDIASMNWYASASYAAKNCDKGLFVDIGSTTSDILLLENKQLNTFAYTDFQRLRSYELVYTGVVRSAVMAISHSVVFKGQEMGLMKEYFATMADVYRVTGELQAAHDQTETADGAEKSLVASTRRLARMLGCDLHDFSAEDWRCFAFSLREQQLLSIQTACEMQLARLTDKTACLFIGAGIGRFLVQEVAQRLGYAYQEFNALFKADVLTRDLHLADCAPAVAVAYLAHEARLLS